MASLLQRACVKSHTYSEHGGRLSDSRWQGCSPCVCQRLQTPKAKRDHKTGPLPSAVCCHLTWGCIRWAGRGGPPHLWARLSQRDSFPHLAHPAGFTLPLDWPPESHWLSPSPTAHCFTFPETEQNLQENSSARWGSRTGRRQLLIMGSWAAFLAAVEWGRWRPRSLHTWAVSTSGWIPCLSRDGGIILATCRISSVLSSSFPFVTSFDPLDHSKESKVDGSHLSLTEEDTGIRKAERFAHVLMGRASYSPLPPPSTSWEFPKMCRFGSERWTWRDDVKLPHPLPPSCPPPLLAPFSVPIWDLCGMVCPMPRVAAWPSPLRVAACHRLSRKLRVTDGWHISLWSRRAGILLPAVPGDIFQTCFWKTEKSRLVSVWLSQNGWLYEASDEVTLNCPRVETIAEIETWFLTCRNLKKRHTRVVLALGASTQGRSKTPVFAVTLATHFHLNLLADHTQVHKIFLRRSAIWL